MGGEGLRVGGAALESVLSLLWEVSARGGSGCVLKAVFVLYAARCTRNTFVIY